MTPPTVFPTETRPKQLRFDRYLLDLNRGCLFLAENEISLRPKTFAILRHLVENPSRLVSKDELFAAVWPNLAITDDVLVQSIGELRRALGDDGARLIRTVPRRGYRFESPVSVIAAVDPFATDGAPTSRAFQDGANSPKLPARNHAAKFFTPAHAGRSGRLLAGLVVSILLIAGVVGTGIGPKFLGLLNSEHQSAENAGFGAKPAIAVLPFLNEGAVSGHEYFAEGLTEDIINLLGQFSGLTVMSWNAVFPYKGKPVSPERSPAVSRCATRWKAASSKRETACG